MIYTHDIRPAFEDVIGKDGASVKRFGDMLARAGTAIPALQKKGLPPALAIAQREDDIAAMEDMAARVATFKTFVVIGMGGSSYGGKALVNLVQNPLTHHTGTHIHFIDNIDPLTADRLLLSLDVKTTIFALISKSGDTAETLAHALIWVQAVKKKLGGDAVRQHFIAITEPRDNALRRLAQAHGMTVLDHDAHIGGRFSVFSHVGLLPAKVAGLDIRAIRRGAAEILQDALQRPDSEPAKGAALHCTLMEQGKNLAVLMPYCDRLDALSTWYRQLWAESLGKGGKGSTPLRALGACDQHSQLQLYLDGPRDKFISLILLENTRKGAALPKTDDPALSYLHSRTLGDLMDAEQRATAETFMRNHCPSRIFGLQTLDEASIGALMMHLMLETIIAGALLGVNPFDQPAVEEGKKLAREYLGSK